MANYDFKTDIALVEKIKGARITAPHVNKTIYSYQELTQLISISVHAVFAHVCVQPCNVVTAD